MRESANIIGNLLSIAVTTSTSGDQTAIAAVAGQTIRVYDIALACDSANALTFKDGATALSGAMKVSGLSLDMSPHGRPRFICTKGNAFVINLGSAVQTSGTIWYTQD